MSCDLRDLWDDWDVSESTDQSSLETHPSTDGTENYAKRFVSMSARRSNASLDGSKVGLWSILQIIEEWKEDQSRMFNVYIILSTIMFLNLMIKIHYLERRLLKMP